MDSTADDFATAKAEEQKNITQKFIRKWICGLSSPPGMTNHQINNSQLLGIQKYQSAEIPKSRNPTIQKC